jgi:hypothetical protein
MRNSGAVYIRLNVQTTIALARDPPPTEGGRELVMMRWGHAATAGHARRTRNEYPQYVVATLADIAQAREPVARLTASLNTRRSQTRKPKEGRGLVRTE